MVYMYVPCVIVPLSFLYVCFYSFYYCPFGCWLSILIYKYCCCCCCRRHFFVTIMLDNFNYIPATNHVSRVYSVSAIL